MKQPHNLKIGETKTFKHFGELQDFAENFEYKENEFDFINHEPLTMQKVN